MKRILWIAAFTAFSIVLKAQSGPHMKGFKIGVGLSLAIPANNLPYTSVGAGFDILAQYAVMNNLAITADAGFTTLFAKSNFESTGVVPLRLGLRYYPSSKLYLAAKAGLGIYTVIKTSINYTAYSFGAGYFLSPKIDIGAAYEGYSNNGSFGYIGIRLGYQFGK